MSNPGSGHASPIFPAVKIYAKLTGSAKPILDAYLKVQDLSQANAVAEIRSTNPLVSYFALRRVHREKVLGGEAVRTMLKAADPFQRAAAIAAANETLGPEAIKHVSRCILDPHPAVVEATLDSFMDGTARTEIAKALLDAIPKLNVARHRQRAMRILGKLKYRQAVDAMEEIFRRRDAIDTPVACQALADIQGRSFLDGITEFLYPDNPLEMHRAILECMAEHPAPVYFPKSMQLLKSLRNKHAILEVVRRIALWSNEGVEVAITLLGHSDFDMADAAQEGLVRHLKSAPNLPAGFMQKLTKTTPDKEASSQTPAAQVHVPPHIEAIEAKLSEAFSTKPDVEFQQLFYLTLTAEKHFLRPKLVQLAHGRWGVDVSRSVEQALKLAKEEGSLLRSRLQNRWATHAEQQNAALRLARIIESVGEAGLESLVKETVRHLDTPNLTVQMAAVATLASIGGPAEAQEIDKRISGAHWMLKRKMAHALAKLVPEAPTAGFFKLCEDPEPLVRISSVRSLDGIRHEKAYNILLKALKDEDERVRSAACAALRIYPDRREVLTRLLEMLKDTDARVRANTVESLEVVLARDPSELRFRLKPLLSDPNARVVINAAKAIFANDPDMALPVLLTYLSAPDENLRAGALWALGQLRRPDAFLCIHFHAMKETSDYVRKFVERGTQLLEGHPFIQDAKYLLSGGVS